MSVPLAASWALVAFLMCRCRVENRKICIKPVIWSSTRWSCPDRLTGAQQGGRLDSQFMRLLILFEPSRLDSFEAEFRTKIWPPRGHLPPTQNGVHKHEGLRRSAATNHRHDSQFGLDRTFGRLLRLPQSALASLHRHDSGTSTGLGLVRCDSSRRP